MFKMEELECSLCKHHGREPDGKVEFVCLPMSKVRVKDYAHTSPHTLKSDSDKDYIFRCDYCAAACCKKLPKDPGKVIAMLTKLVVTGGF
jgi:hypothetical protein